MYRKNKKLFNELNQIVLKFFQLRNEIDIKNLYTFLFVTFVFVILFKLKKQPRSHDFFSGEEHIDPKKCNAKIKKLNTSKIARCTRFSS